MGRWKRSRLPRRLWLLAMTGVGGVSEGLEKGAEELEKKCGLGAVESVVRGFLPGGGVAGTAPASPAALSVARDVATRANASGFFTGSPVGLRSPWK